MKASAGPLISSKYFTITLMVIVVCFSLIRFVHINADFPAHITTSGALYTDEGWYAGSAIRHYLTGQWYLEGDVNTAVLEPGSQILYRVSFALFGMSLSSARIVIATAFLSLLVLMALWIRKYYGNSPALLCALLLSTNYFAFAFSRLALRFLVASFFIVASLYVADGVRNKLGLLKIFVASLLLAWGILTYIPALFATPVLLFLIWQNGLNTKGRLLLLIVPSMILTIVLGSYYFMMFKMYPSYIASEAQPITSAFTSASVWLLNLLKRVYYCINYIGPDFSILTFVFSGAALAMSRQFRANTLVRVLIGYIITYFAILSVSTYGPPRYYLLLLAPFTGLCAISCKTIFDWLSEHKLVKIAYLPVILILVVSFHGSWNIVNYMIKPQYSFYQMAQSVRKIIQEREGTTKGVILYGEMADSLSLEIGTNAINYATWISNTAPARMAKYHPKYLIVHASNVDQVAISEGAKVTELGRWDVLDNFYANGEQVRLYFAEWP